MDGSYQKKRSVEAETMVWSRMSGKLRVVSSCLPKLFPRPVLVVEEARVALEHKQITLKITWLQKDATKRLGQEIGLEIDDAHRNLRNKAAAMADGGGSMRAAWWRSS